jgi:hypothetical protein
LTGADRRYCAAKNSGSGETKKAAVAAFLKRIGSLTCDLRFGTASAELLAEFFNAAGGIDDLVFAGVERVRFSGNLDLHERICFTFELDGFASVDGRTGNEFEIAGQIVEHDFAIFRVSIFFHACLK